jgi:predicted acetyltransferase
MHAKSPPANVELVRATAEQMPVVANLLQLYIHDFSEFLDVELGQDGRFDYPHLPLYWREPGRHPYLVRIDGKLAGLVLVKQRPASSGDATVWDMAEFFVARAFRRNGAGTRIAREVWRRFPGRWEVRVMEANAAACRFWQHAVAEFAGDAMVSSQFEANGENWRLFSFASAPVA